MDIREKSAPAHSRFGDLSGAVGAGGLVLELDELETMDQLWNVRSRTGAYAVLGRLLVMKHVLPVFAVTDRFHRLISSDVEDRGILRAEFLSPDARRFLVDWRSRHLPVVRPAIFTPDLARKLVDRIIQLYVGVYKVLKPPDRRKLVDEWMTGALRTPRTLIRKTVYALDLALVQQRENKSSSGIE